MERTQQRPRPARTPAAPPQPVPTLRPATAPAGGGVQVIWGAMAEMLDLAEMTVGEAYRLLSTPFHIAPAVTALVNGRMADADHRLAVGDVLEFARPAGEKGARA